MNLHGNTKITNFSKLLLNSISQQQRFVREESINRFPFD